MASPWNAPLHGAPIQTVVKVNVAPTGKQVDVVVSRNNVGVLRGSERAPAPDNAYEVDFVYNVESHSGDIFDRTVLPLVRRVAEGYHAACIFMGTSSSGRLEMLHGAKMHPGILELAGKARQRRP